MGILSRNNVGFFCVKVIDIKDFTEIQIYYENETVSTPLWTHQTGCNTVLIKKINKKGLQISPTAVSHFSFIYNVFIYLFIWCVCVCFKKISL